AIAALNDLEVEPGLLDLLADGSASDRLDGRDRMPDRSRDRHHAGSSGDAIQVHRAGAAERSAATELGPVHAEQVAQDPEQRHLRRRFDYVRHSIHLDRDGHRYLPIAGAPPGQRTVLKRWRFSNTRICT